MLLEAASGKKGFHDLLPKNRTVDRTGTGQGTWQDRIGDITGDMTGQDRASYRTGDMTGQDRRQDRGQGTGHGQRT